MEREQMIEVMAQKVCIACGKCKELKGDCYLAQNIAHYMIGSGYRKIHDGAVVLTKEEYDKLNNRIAFGVTWSDEKLKEFVQEAAKKFEIDIDKLRKETARKIYVEIKEKLWSTLYLPICDEEETDWATREVLDLLKTTIKNICNVEVEE